MRTTLAILLVSATLACKKDDPAPPAPSPQPQPTCCPTVAPSLILPANGATLNTPILWKWRKVPGTHHYVITANCNWTANGQNYQAVLLSTTTTDTSITQAQLPTIPVSWHGATGQWRVLAMGDDNSQSPWSAYRQFTVQ